MHHFYANPPTAPVLKDVLAHLALDKYVGTPGPRGKMALCQVPFAVALLLVVLAVAVFSPATFTAAAFRGFLALFALVMLMCLAVPWHRLPARGFVVVPALDFLLIALAREATGETVISMGLLLVFPVIWLSVSLGKAGVLLSFLGTVLIVLVPLLTRSGVASGDFARPFLLPTIMLVIALSVHAMAASMKDQQARLQAKDSELRHALTVSESRERLLDTVLETVPAGVQAVDPAGKPVLINRQQRRYRDLAAVEHGGNENSAQENILHDGTGEGPQVFAADRITPLPMARYPINRALRQETFTDYLIWLGPLDRQRAVSTAAHAITDDSGRFLGSVLAFTDVTDLIEALTVRDDFIANVSHEFRTPLTAILGFLDLALEIPDRLPADITAQLRIAQRNAERLMSLVTDLLCTSTAAPAMKEQHIDLADIIGMCVASAGPRASRSNITLSQDLESPLWACADPGRIAQVLDNLLSNAIKYTPAGGTVTVRARASEGSVSFEVADTGIGMNTADTARIFSKYFRSRAVRGSQIPGIGLGLGIVKTIVENHGGTITVTSTPGRGSTFTVTLPTTG